MYVPSHEHSGQAPLASFSNIYETFHTKNSMWSSDNTSTDLAKEWRNPSVIIVTILMLSGGNVIRAALAQSAGNWYTPVCFSFGWISYSLSTLVDVFGDGNLLPPPDYPVKVFNITSGNHRENRNWIIGRIVRDHQTWISKQEPLNDNAIRITVCEAEYNRLGCLSIRYSKLHVAGIITMTIQLVIASIPTILTNGQEWGVLIVTAVGTLLAIIMGCLPQWIAEKLPHSKQSKHQTYALTAGNGSRDVMVIKGMGECLRLEELAAHESPMEGRPWVKFERYTTTRRNSMTKLSKEIWGYPKGFFITLCVSVILAILWLLLFITIPALHGHTWFFIMVGGIGLLHNAIIAGIRRKPKQRNLPLKYKDVIVARTVMDGLMDLEMDHPDCGKPLVGEFFPGNLLMDENEWWAEKPRNRKHTKYDKKRYQERERRYWPRSMDQQDDTIGGDAGLPDSRAKDSNHATATDPQDHTEAVPGEPEESQSVVRIDATKTSAAQNVTSSPRSVVADPTKLTVPRFVLNNNEDESRRSSIAEVLHGTASNPEPKRRQADNRQEVQDDFSKAPFWD